MNRSALLVCAATLLLAGCVLPAPDELTFVDASGPARLDGTGDLTVFSAFTPSPDGPAGPAPGPQNGCQTNFEMVAADGDAADGCSECIYTFLVNLGVGMPPGDCQDATEFPDQASHLPYADAGDFPGAPVEGISIGVTQDGAWWDGGGDWSLWIEGEPGANSFDGVGLDWRNTGTNSWVREEVNFSWTTAAEE